ncbi:hypothetical protein [Planktotalea sp.]
MIPARNDEGSSASEMSEYVAELTVPADSKLIGKRISEIDSDAEKS